MKKLLLPLLLLFSIITHAQLQESTAAEWKEIGKLKFGGITKARLEYTVKGSDTTFLLLVKDVREQPKDHYFSITFRNTDGAFEKLYAILKSFFLDENKKNKQYSRTFKLGDKGVNIQYHMLIGGRGIRFATEDGYTYWTDKDVDKLFNRD